MGTAVKKVKKRSIIKGPELLDGTAIVRSEKSFMNSMEFLEFLEFLEFPTEFQSSKPGF